VVTVETNANMAAAYEVRTGRESLEAQTKWAFQFWTSTTSRPIGRAYRFSLSVETRGWKGCSQILMEGRSCEPRRLYPARGGLHASGKRAAKWAGQICQIK
jgi:hypothetical protein